MMLRALLLSLVVTCLWATEDEHTAQEHDIVHTICEEIHCADWKKMEEQCIDDCDATEATDVLLRICLNDCTKTAAPCMDPCYDAADKCDPRCHGGKHEKRCFEGCIKEEIKIPELPTSPEESSEEE